MEEKLYWSQKDEAVNNSSINGSEMNSMAGQDRGRREGTSTPFLA